jgi:hypothetical protein
LPRWLGNSVSQHPRSKFDASKAKESSSELNTKTTKHKQHRRLKSDY